MRSDILGMEDLAPGMVLTGVVRNVIDFGAFVDIGVHQDGLVHISQIANKFIKLVNYGETMVSQVTDKDTNRDMSYEYEVLYKMGINVILSTVFGVWEIV